MQINRHRGKNPRVIPVAAAVVALWFGIPALFNIAAQAAAPERILVGISLPLSGGLGSTGTDTLRGYELFRESLNAGGGLMLREYGKRLPVEFKTYDSETIPSKEITNVQRLVNSDGVDLLLGSAGTPLVLAGASVADRLKKVYVASSTTVYAYSERGYRYVFIPFITDEGRAKSLFDFIESVPEAERPKKIGIWEENTDLGAGMREWIARYCKDLKASCFVEKYTVGATDFTALIRRSKEQGADLVAAIPTPPDGVLMIRQSKELGFNPLFVMPRAEAATIFTAQLGANGDYVIGYNAWNPSLPYKGAKELAQSYQNKYKQAATSTVGNGYIVAQVFFAAVEKAGTLDNEKIRDAMANLKMETVGGPVQFPLIENGRTYPAHGYVPRILTQLRAGRQEVIWPREVRSMEPALRPPPWDKR